MRVGLNGKSQREIENNLNSSPVKIMVLFVPLKVSFLLQLHLVHWNSESHPSFKDTVSSGDPNGLCVLGFFLKVTCIGDPSF